MSLDLRITNPSKMHLQKARLLLAEVAQRINSGKDKTAVDALASLQKAFSDYFTTLGSPSYTGYEIQPDDLIDPDEFARQLRLIQADLNSLYADCGNLSRAAVDGFNLNQALVVGTEAELKKTVSLAQDTQMITGIGDNLVFTAGDDFVNLQKVDPSKVNGTTLFVDTDQTALVLPRTASQNIGPKVKAVGILPRTASIYEGNYYCFDGYEVPEGGKYRLDALQKRGFGARFGDALFDGPKPEADLQAQRLKMTDDNADTFWLCEVVENLHTSLAGTTQITGTDSTGKSFVKQENETVFLDDQSQITKLTAINGAIDTSSVDGVTASEQTNNIDVLFGKTDSANIPRLKNLKLTVDMDFVLTEPSTLNWINLVPLYNHPSAFLQVNSVQIGVRQKDGSVKYSPLPGMDDGRYEKILTPEANEELTDEERLATLSPDRFGFAGQGLWTFASIDNVVGVRVSITQATPVPASYHVLRFEMERVMTDTTTVTKKTKVVGITTKKSSKTTTTTTNLVRLVELDRSNTLKAVLGNRSSDQLAGVTNAGDQTNSNEKADNFTQFLEKGGIVGIQADKYGGDIAGLLGGVAKAVGGAIAGLIGSTKSTKTSTVDTGWQVKDQYLVPKYDKIKWQIGLRELGLYRNLYAEQGQMVSARFKVPDEILKVTLRADEWVPEELRFLDPVRDWIKYEISLDDRNWFQIVPEAEGVSSKLDSRRVLPQVYNVNSDIGETSRDTRQGYITVEGSARNIRLRVSMFGSATQNSLTPVLKGYRMNLFTKRTY